MKNNKENLKINHGQSVIELSLTLISFLSNKINYDLSHELSEIGYKINLISGNDWFSLPPDNIYNIRIVFLSRDNNVFDKVSTVLKNSKSIPTLVVFNCKLPTWDSEITQQTNEFILWPCDRDELVLRLMRLQSKLSIKPIDTTTDSTLDEFVGLNMIGRSPVFLETLDLIKKIARCDAPVCIEGETGTGKELAARAIHYLGARRDQSFIPVNCGAIPDNLVESEFFGHKRGAFTDAKETYSGVVEQSNHGTLFLDEVDALSNKAQIVLLRFLQDYKYKPLGSSKFKKADVRIIAATNGDIPTLVKQGCFRQDLVYRLNIMLVNMPSLAMRGAGDIELLANHFIHHCNARYGKSIKKLHPDLIEWMNHYQWPGNVRELENFILREYMLEEGDIILGNVSSNKIERRQNCIDRRKLFSFDGGFSLAKSRLINDFEKGYLSWLMKETKGNVTMAAKRSGKERRALGKLLKKYGIEKNLYFG